VALTQNGEVVRAAGGVVRRVDLTGPQVLLVHRPRYGDWTFPKGKANPGEADEQTARREVEEETGLRCELIAELPSTAYRDSRGREKIVRYWTMRPESGSFTPHDEVDTVSWVGDADGAARLSYPRDVDVLRAVPPPLLVVRHASAGDRTEWTEANDARPLDERGRRQANALVECVAGFGIGRLVSSPFTRCVQTLQPLAEKLGLQLELSDDLAEGAGPERALELLLSLAGAPAVVCGHSPELEPLFGRIRKGAAVAVEAGGGKLTELGRLPPP
jgi:8-oxo-(d)GTP phosphatase